jgi:aminomethyltransferase
MKKTFLYKSHLSLSASMAPFGGFDMPIRYEGILTEHFRTRKEATVFDTCHMGEFSIKGPSSIVDLDKIVSCDIATLAVGQCRYGLICNENGGVLDDQITYRLGEQDFFMVVNASTQDADFEWITRNISAGTSIVNLSAETGKIDLQGPRSPGIIAKLLKHPIDNLKYYHWMDNEYSGRKIIVSRTGYTGEIGFEIYLDEQRTVQFWNDCLELGAKPAGLGARDTLRLEMGYPLYGHELDRDRNAAESGFSKAIAAGKEFIGSEAMRASGNVHNTLCGIKLDGRRTTRNGDSICSGDGQVIGRVTSGSFSPSLGCAIAMGYIAVPHSTAGNPVYLDSSGHRLPGTISKIPFYTSATARRPMRDFLS